ncbi:spermidine/putrescine ABC transporter substrate-binding lipoprotein PotD [Mycoplasmopsis bovirhinis]|uniref:hypothetical protein n=1 Tax=Mycoplasmopsis bovirhinis TaxID=29553 RepID=UPI000BB9D18E|nr:hypothetical protein [Mycoplasmopsis bovirhinis]BBA22389.1 spermidine/putrescine ABC transporter substrate-binding lipoprotein PotD [Mycoplasmopsis bovirhinis]
MKKNFWKTHKNKVLVSSGILSVAGIFTAVLSTKLTKKFKPSFYNYKSYMSSDNIDKLNETFDYKEFDEINQFSTALINNKAVAGIGSDFLAAELVRKKLIGKIDYASLLGLEELEGFLEYDKLKTLVNSQDFTNYSITEQETYKKELSEAFNKKQLIKQFVKLTLRPEIWDHLLKYKLEDDNELWEYFYPYFSQDMVVSYNIKKNPIAVDNATGNGSIDFEKYKNTFQNNDIKDPLSLVNVLKIMSLNNFNKWYITDSIRDNMMYGSSYWPLPTGRTENNFTGYVLDNETDGNETYKILIDAFADLINDGTGYNIKDANHIAFKGDGLEIVNDLINPSRNDVNVAIMYNGDAIDAYYGKDNFPNLVEDGHIRAIKPKNNILLLDGLVISSGVSKENAKKYAQKVSESFFQGTIDIINSYKALLENNAIKELRLGTNQVDFTHMQTKTMFKRLATNWKELKINELSELETASLNQEYLNQFISKFTNLIDLSLEENKASYDEYLAIQENYQNNQKVDFSDRINLFVKIIKNYLDANLSDFYQLAINNIEESKKAIEYQNSYDSFEKALIYEFISSNLEELKEALSKHSTLKEKKDFIGLFLARKIAILDFSTIKDKYNFTNFDYVNYVPTNISDYEQVLQNYFLDPISGHDETAINLYEINNKTGIIHENIQPVSDELQSKITTYYFNKTKS